MALFVVLQLRNMNGHSLNNMLYSYSALTISRRIFSFPFVGYLQWWHKAHGPAWVHGTRWRGGARRDVEQLNTVPRDARHIYAHAQHMAISVNSVARALRGYHT